MTSTVILRALDEAEMGAGWAAEFSGTWPAYRAWYLSEGEAARPTYLACVRALKKHMPELLPLYERAVNLAGGDDLVARYLSGYQPPAYIAGCSQAIFRERILVRNYDYSPELWEKLFVRSAWRGRRVLGMSDCSWGLLDGLNDEGVAVSLAFGGRRIVGRGFGIPLVMRYVLEMARTTEEATEILCRVPVHMAYNVSIVDRDGHYQTVMLGPDREPRLSQQRVITNHQERVEWHRHALATGSVDRLRFLTAHVRDPAEDEGRFVRRFLEPPVLSTSHAAGLGTLYTAVYRPAALRGSYLWPDGRWDVDFEDPVPATFTATLRSD